MAIALKRTYEQPEERDGVRILVERLWPRGVSKEAAALDHWFKDLAPSPDLRIWYGHRPERWPEFQRRYRDELEAADPDIVDALISICRKGQVTFLFAARDKERNSAVVLRDYVLEAINNQA